MRTRGLRQLGIGTIAKLLQIIKREKAAAVFPLIEPHIPISIKNHELLFTRSLTLG